MSLYLVRHGQTEFNAAGRYQGWLDSPLTALGRAQAARVGATIATLVPRGTAIVSSPLGRAIATARIIAEIAGLATPETDDRLAEISLGRWDGMTDEDIEFTHPGSRDGSDRWNWYFASPDGETWEEITARASGWLAEATASKPPLVVVSHGVTGRVLRGLYAGLDRDTAQRQDVPQDAVFRLSDGRVDRIDCG